MTGYNPRFVPFVFSSDGERLLFDNFQSVFYVIHDGSRLGAGLHNDFPVMDNGADGPVIWTSYDCYPKAGSFTSADLDNCRHAWISQSSTLAPGNVDSTTNEITLDWNRVESQCDLLWHASEYSYQYGLGGFQNISSVFNNSGTMIDLPSPALSISSYVLFNVWVWNPGSGGNVPYIKNELTWAVMPYGSDWLDSAGHTERVFNGHGVSPTDILFATNQSSHIFNADEVSRNGTCQQPGPGVPCPVRYSWGFSAQLLLAWLVMLFIWTLGLYALHMDTYLKGDRALLKRDMGLKRAMFDLTNEYRKKIDENDVSMASEKDLQDLISDGRISYSYLMTSHTTSSTGTRMKAWKSSKWSPGSWRFWTTICIPLRGISIAVMTFGFVQK